MNQGSTKYKKLRFPKEFYPNPPSYFTYEPEKLYLGTWENFVTSQKQLEI